MTIFYWKDKKYNSVSKYNVDLVQTLVGLEVIDKVNSGDIFDLVVLNCTIFYFIYVKKVYANFFFSKIKKQNIIMEITLIDPIYDVF